MAPISTTTATMMTMTVASMSGRLPTGTWGNPHATTSAATRPAWTADARGTVGLVGELVRLQGDEATVDAVVEPLEREGCVVVERFIGGGKVAALKAELQPYREATPLGRNDFEGHATKRIYALFAKTRGFDELATHPLLLG